MKDSIVFKLAIVGGRSWPVRATYREVQPSVAVLEPHVLRHDGFDEEPARVAAELGVTLRELEQLLRLGAMYAARAYALNPERPHTVAFVRRAA